MPCNVPPSCAGLTAGSGLTRDLLSKSRGTYSAHANLVWRFHFTSTVGPTPKRLSDIPEGRGAFMSEAMTGSMTGFMTGCACVLEIHDWASDCTFNVYFLPRRYALELTTLANVCKMYGLLICGFRPYNLVENDAFFNGAVAIICASENHNNILRFPQSMRTRRVLHPETSIEQTVSDLDCAASAPRPGGEKRTWLPLVTLSYRDPP